MSNSNSSIIKVENLQKSSKYECLDCENYKRKVKEAEQSVSGRDVLIEMLQGEIKKMEDRYKVSIDDYELLRFKYCTVVQELGNLKEIHRKLEASNLKLTKERDNAVSQVEGLQNEMESCKKQCEKGGGIESAVAGDSLHQNILKEVQNIEVILQNQNETVNDVLKTVLTEMRGSKVPPEVLPKEAKYDENMKDQNKEELLAIIEELNKEMSRLNALVEKLKSEKDSIHSQLEEKKNNLSQCLEVLEDNHSNLNNLSGSIEMIIKEKENSAGEIERLTKENEELHRALQDCEKQLDQIQGNDLENVIECTAECNKGAKPSVEIKNEDFDQSGAGDVSALNEKIENLEKSLEKAKLQNDEYEKENKTLTEKVEDLTTQMKDFENEKLEMENKITEISKIADEKYEALNSQKESEINELNAEIDKLKKENEECVPKEQFAEMEEKLATAEEEKAKLIEENEASKNQLTNMETEIAQLKENGEKQTQMMQEKIEKLEDSESEKQKEIEQCCCIIKNIEKAVKERSLEQLNELETQNNELQEKIKALQTEVETYQNLYKDCECSSQKQEAEIGHMETSITKLEDTIKELETELQQRECLNEKLQEELKEMEVEICRRQCTINHLEECLDKSNQILAECEKEMKDLHTENESLKQDNESAQNELQSYVTEVERTTLERNMLQEQISAVNRQSQNLEKEKDQLLGHLKDKSTIEDQLIESQEQYNNLVKTIEEKDEELKKAKELIETLESELEAGKKEKDEIKNAYKEVKNTLSDEIKRYNKETEKLSTDNISANGTTEPKCSACLTLNDLNIKLTEKERTIKALEDRNRELASEAAQNKSYVTKLITDNNTLRKAVDTMLASLLDKLKTFTDNEDTTSLKSNESIVEDILTSLTELEKNVTDPTPSEERCNCMSVIKSTYSIDGAESKNLVPCKLACGKPDKDMSQYLQCAKASSTGMKNFCDKCCSDKYQGGGKAENSNGKTCDDCINLRKDERTE